MQTDFKPILSFQKILILIITFIFTACAADAPLWQSAREISLKTAQFSSGEQLSFLGEKDGQKFFLFASQSPMQQAVNTVTKNQDIIFLQIEKSLKNPQILLLKAPKYLQRGAKGENGEEKTNEKMRGIFSPNLGQIDAPNDNDIYYFYQISGDFSGAEEAEFCIQKTAANAECVEILLGYKSLNYHLEERF